MKKRNHLIVEYNEFKEFNEQREREEIYRTEKKDQHLGASKVLSIVLDDMKGYIYGENPSDSSRSESGSPHIHLETPRGESEYYFNETPFELTYKDGVKLSDSEYNKLTHEMKRYEKLIDNSTINGVYAMWDCENVDNKKCTVF